MNLSARLLAAANEMIKGNGIANAVMLMSEAGNLLSNVRLTILSTDAVMSIAGPTFSVASYVVNLQPTAPCPTGTFTVQGPSESVPALMTPIRFDTR